MDSPPPQRKAAGFVPPPGLGSPVQEAAEAMQRRPEDMAGANVPGRGLDQAMADYAFQNFQNWSPPNAGKGSAGYGNRAMPAGPSRAPGAHLAPQPGAGMMAGSAGSGKGSAVAQSALQSLQMFQGSDARGAEETSAMQRAAAEQLQKQRMAEANRNDPDAQRSAAENAALENARRLKNSPLVQDLALRNANVSKGKEEKRYSGILKVFRPEHGWGFIENPELKSKYGSSGSSFNMHMVTGLSHVQSDIAVICTDSACAVSQLLARDQCGCHYVMPALLARLAFLGVFSVFATLEGQAKQRLDSFSMAVPLIYSERPVTDTSLSSEEQGATCHQALRLNSSQVKAVQVRRVEALIISLILVALGVVLTLVTLVGGLSRGVLLERFGWITLANGPEFRYLGMRFACLSEGSLRSPAFAERWSGNHDRCVPLNALACPVEEQLRSERFSKSGFSLQLERVQCSACRNATAVLLLPILITMATYVKLIQGTTARLMWRDTAINKVLLVLSGIVGGIANLGLMAIYHGTCITTLRRAELFLQPELGPGHDVFLNQAVEGGIKLGSLVSFTLEMSKDGKPQARNARMEAEKVDRPKTSAPGQEARELVGKVFKGRVKSFNATNGFGFLTCEELKSKFNGRDIYVNHTQVPGGGSWVPEPDCVYTTFKGREPGYKGKKATVLKQIWAVTTGLEKKRMPQMLPAQATKPAPGLPPSLTTPAAASNQAAAQAFRGLHGRKSNFKLVESAVDRVYSSVLDGNAHYYKALVADPADFSTYQALYSELEYKPAWMSGGLALHRPTALGSESQLRQSPTYERIVRFLAGYFGVEPIRSLVNHYRSGEDFTSFHSDQYFSGVNMTIGASFGEERALVFEHRETKEQFSFPQHNGDVFAFTDSVNRQFVHGVPRERRARSTGACGHTPGRISVIVWGRKDQELWKTRAQTLPLTLQPLNVLENDPSKEASLDEANRPETAGKDTSPDHDGLARTASPRGRALEQTDTRPARWKTLAKSPMHGY
ncbi:unnamed protein product [Symbiodinium sp. CCMP2456]|nr:unnamed protein product [Symbiodinium sp. CCMP2456]